MFKIDYSQDYNENWFERVKYLDEFLLYNFSEPSSLFPLLGDISYDYHSLNPQSIFFHISELKDRDIHVVCPDINYLENFSLIEKKINFNSKITLYGYPWFFLNQYFLKNVYVKNNNDFDIKDKAIFLSGGKKLCRLHVIKELKNYNNFLYSNMGYFEELNEGNSERGKITECFLKGNYFYIKINGQDFEVTGDFNIGNLKFQYDDFDTNEKIYYPAFKNDYKNVKTIKFDDPVFAYELVPQEYLQSALSFFCETQTVKTTHLTEKTIKNFYYKKPFFGFASKGYYNFLLKNNFVLYDELFDYSLDTYEYGDRMKSFVSQCKKILEMELSELINIVFNLNEKIEHNYQNCKRISDNFHHLYNISDEEQIDYILGKII